MILFTVLTIILIILAIITIAVVSIFGAGAIVVFADVLVCIAIIGYILYRIIRRKYY